jgi:pyruvate formate lyase activating enzyme
MVKEALKSGDQGLCVSFNEPTLLFEYCLDVFPLAKTNGLYNTFVSNGYLTCEALAELIKAGLDAIKIDLKGNDEVYKRYCHGEAEKVWEVAHYAKLNGIHLEIVNLIITGVNDTEKEIKSLIKRHVQEVGEDTPLHFTRYYPAYRFNNPPTSEDILKKAYQWAKDAGVLYPYLGNMPGHWQENTYCPKCKKLLIKRLGYQIVECKLTENNQCPECGFRINIHLSYQSCWKQEKYNGKRKRDNWGHLCK